MSGIYTQEMLDSIKNVEATRPSRIGFEPRRMTAEEKDALLAKFHPDYKKENFDTLAIGPNKGESPEGIGGAFAGAQPYHYKGY